MQSYSSSIQNKLFLSLQTYYEVSLIVIDVYFTICHAEEEYLAVWRPCHMSKLASL